MREATEWHRVSFYGRLAEVAGQYLRKGSQVYIEGSLRTRKWQDQSGQERYSTEIRGDQMQMLGRREGMGEAPMRSSDGGFESAGRPARSQGGNPPQSPAQNQPPSSGLGDFDDDIPF